MVKRRTKSFLKLTALILALLFVPHAANGTTVIIPADDDMIIGARAIIRGRVLAIGSKLDETSGRIFTYVTVRVQEVFKGQLSEREIVIKEEGGEVDNLGSVVFGTPKFAIGERVFLYLTTWQDGSLRVHNMFLGKFSITSDPRTGKPIVVRDTPDANTVVMDSSSVGRPRQPATSRMELDRYIALVKERLRATRKQARAVEDTYFTGAAMFIRPPEFVAAEPGEIRPQFALFPGGTPARWFEPDEGQPVTYVVNLESAPAQALSDVTAAMNAWSTVTGTALRLVNGGATGGCTGPGVNALVFNNCDGRYAPGPCSGILALGGLNWNNQQRKTVNGVTFNRATMGFVSFNPCAAADFADPCKLREITTHELGHTVGLGHSQFSDATMFGFAHYDGRCASLRQDDREAIVFVYPGSTGGGPLAIATATVLPAGSLNTSYSVGLTATGGTAPYGWSLISGTASLPAGLSLSSNGVISGTPTAGGTSNFTVQVTDAASATASKAFSLTITTSVGGFDSQYVSQSVPATVQPSAAFFATVRLLNIGAHAWDPVLGFRLGSQNPPNNRTWGGDSVLPGSAVTQPGQQVDLVFQAVAPSTNGIYNFQWQTWQQNIGFFGQKSANVPVVVTDGSVPTITGFSTLTLGQGSPAIVQQTVTGGVPAYSWRVIAGTLPDGLSLTTGGLLQGTPTTLETATVTIQVTDAIAQTGQRTLTINVVPPPPEVATLQLGVGEKNKPYSATLTGRGGKPPYQWSVVSGALPAGLSLAGNGTLSGTPSVDGSFPFTIGLTDADAKTAQKLFTLIINPPPLVLASAVNLDLGRGSAFSYQLVATGGRLPYTWSMASGALPEGVSLNASTGVISGVPTIDGTYNVVVKLRDQPGTEVTTALQIRVLDPGSIPVIKKAKYKGGKKLVVTVKNLNPAGVLLVDGVPTGGPPSGNQFKLSLTLAPGSHEIRIVNPGQISSLPVIITAQ